MTFFSARPVSKILSSFTTTLEELEERSGDLLCEIEKYQKEIAEVSAKKTECSLELTRANVVANKLKDFLNLA